MAVKNIIQESLRIMTNYVNSIGLIQLKDVRS